MKSVAILGLVVIAIFLLGVFASCSAPSAPATPNPAEVGMTMMADKVNAEATQARLGIIFTTTAQIVGATSTQQAQYIMATGTQQARLDAEATSQQSHAWAQATSDQARRDVQATQSRIDADATQEQARRDAEATSQQARLDMDATFRAAGTATAFVITQTAIPPANTYTAIANQQSIALANNNVQMSNLEVEQQRQKNTPEWVVPFLIAIIATIVGGIYAMRWSRVREVKDEDGTIRMVIFDNQRAVAPALLPGPVLTMTKEAVTMPLLTATVDEQARVTERAQAVEAIKAMPQNPTSSSASAFNHYFGNDRQDVPFDVIDADDTPPAGLIDGQSMQSLNKDWKDAKDAQQ